MGSLTQETVERQDGQGTKELYGSPVGACWFLEWGGQQKQAHLIRASSFLAYQLLLATFSDPSHRKGLLAQAATGRLGWETLKLQVPLPTPAQGEF